MPSRGNNHCNDLEMYNNRIRTEKTNVKKLNLIGAKEAHMRGM